VLCAHSAGGRVSPQRDNPQEEKALTRAFGATSQPAMSTLAGPSANGSKAHVGDHFERAVIAPKRRSIQPPVRLPHPLGN
jgi:hypothetical protein